MKLKTKIWKKDGYIGVDFYRYSRKNGSFYERVRRGVGGKTLLTKGRTVTFVFETNVSGSDIFALRVLKNKKSYQIELFIEEGAPIEKYRLRKEVQKHYEKRGLPVLVFLRTTDSFGFWRSVAPAIV